LDDPAEADGHHKRHDHGRRGDDVADRVQGEEQPNRREVDVPGGRASAKVFFGLLPAIEVVGGASDGSEGVAMARRLEPDVVLLDCSCPTWTASPPSAESRPSALKPRS